MATPNNNIAKQLEANTASFNAHPAMVRMRKQRAGKATLTVTKLAVFGDLAGQMVLEIFRCSRQDAAYEASKLRSMPNVIKVAVN